MDMEERRGTEKVCRRWQGARVGPTLMEGQDSLKQNKTKTKEKGGKKEVGKGQNSPASVNSMSLSGQWQQVPPPRLTRDKEPAMWFVMRSRFSKQGDQWIFIKELVKKKIHIMSHLRTVPPHAKQKGYKATERKQLQTRSPPLHSMFQSCEGFDSGFWFRPRDYKTRDCTYSKLYYMK